jgi:intraflagellar transport protein 20
MADSLAKSGLYFDELSKIRVLEPEVAQETNKLKEECRDFVESKYRMYRTCHSYKTVDSILNFYCNA